MTRPSSQYRDVPMQNDPDTPLNASQLAEILLETALNNQEVAEKATEELQRTAEELRTTIPTQISEAVKASVLAEIKQLISRASTKLAEDLRIELEGLKTQIKTAETEANGATAAYKAATRAAQKAGVTLFFLNLGITILVSSVISLVLRK